MCAALRFDGGAAAAYAALMARDGVVNTADPPATTLLTAPLYEDSPNHVNATWLDANAPHGQLVLRWIDDGAPQWPPREDRRGRR
ncbi:MAG: hypothetical protein D6689_03115 [Deltaproteobacteria bacterium]|nr:MAG: hypothetical protein D6689_03115 [Deltaproteobacteria bacterium]